MNDRLTAQLATRALAIIVVAVVGLAAVLATLGLARGGAVALLVCGAALIAHSRD
jgi:hypothetical protein